MSKTETITALIDSATTVFAETGYEGASLRDIAAGARAPLSTINMYFGTKGDLFIAVMGELWREIEEERAGDTPSPQTPSQVLARIEIPPEVSDAIAQMIVPGSALIVSDQGLGDETGEGTDFDVVTR